MGSGTTLFYRESAPPDKFIRGKLFLERYLTSPQSLGYSGIGPFFTKYECGDPDDLSRIPSSYLMDDQPQSANLPAEVASPSPAETAPSAGEVRVADKPGEADQPPTRPPCRNRSLGHPRRWRRPRPTCKKPGPPPRRRSTRKRPSARPPSSPTWASCTPAIAGHWNRRWSNWTGHFPHCGRSSRPPRLKRSNS